MNGTTHMIVGGMTGGLLLAYSIANHTPTLSFSGYEIYPVVATVAAAMGGLALDVDMAHSTAGRTLRRNHIFGNKRCHICCLLCCYYWCLI